jgi:hypothetical protein
VKSQYRKSHPVKSELSGAQSEWGKNVPRRRQLALQWGRTRVLTPILQGQWGIAGILWLTFQVLNSTGLVLRYCVKSNMPTFIQNNAINYIYNFVCLNLNPTLLAELTPRCLVDCFSQLNHAARYTPMPLARLVGASCQKHLALPKGNGV